MTPRNFFFKSTNYRIYKQILSTPCLRLYSSPPKKLGGSRMGKRLASIYRKIKTDYKKSRRLNDLPKVTQQGAGRPRTEGRSAEPPHAPAPFDHGLSMGQIHIDLSRSFLPELRASSEDEKFYSSPKYGCYY